MESGVAFNLILNIPEDRLKLIEFVVVQAIVDDESNRHHREDILTTLFIEVSHIEEKMFFVTQALIPLNFVVDTEALRRIAFLLNWVLPISLRHI